jgi:hypothetical protein
MVNKSSLIPGLSKFIDESILIHYPATSMKRILMAGAVSLYLKQTEGAVDTLIGNPLFRATGVVHDNMIDIDTVRDVLKSEINKAGFMRMSLPIVGDIDFTPDDVDTLHRFITESNTRATTVPIQQQVINNSGVY